MRLFSALCLMAAVFMRAEEPDTHLLLKQIGRAVGDAISRSDNYICAQDLSRFYYARLGSSEACRQPPVAPERVPRLQDRLKLDVAVSQGSEIYSWHGEHKFSANNVAQLIHEGPISSGSFNGYLRNIFAESNVKFVFRGKRTVDGVPVYEFDYAVPLAASHYRMQAGNGFELAPFHGSFSARTDNFELYSLTVTADGDQIPSKSNICVAETRLIYQLVKIAGHESLLPASFDLLMEAKNGIFTDSKGKYSGCREYSGESTVHFDSDDSAKGADAPPEIQTEPLRSGVYLPIVLRGEIDEDSAYAGLPVEAGLARDVKLKKGVVLRRGAMLKGTITRFQIRNEPTHRVIVKIEFNSVTDGMKLYLCNAVHDFRFAMLPLFVNEEARRLRSERIGFDEPPPDGSMIFDTPHLQLDHSFSSVFVTTPYSETDPQ